MNMKILALNWCDLKNPCAGGAEVHLEELLRRLVKFGYDITLFSSGFKNCKKEEIIEGVKIIRRGSRYNFNIVAPFYLRRLVKYNKFDLLIESINKIPFYTPLYLKIKTLVVIPHLFSTSIFKEINPLIGSYIYFMELPMIKVYGKFKFNVISKSTLNDMIARGVAKKNISLIHCGIDKQIYNYNPTVKKFNRPTILYLGRIKKYKSIQHLILAVNKVKVKIPQVQLLIVGSGDYLSHLKNLVQSLNLNDCIKFCGYVSTEEKITYLRKSHVSVLPSLKEGWGLTNIEANAIGLPVIASNVPGLKDSVNDGISGLLFEYGNINQMAEKIILLLSNHQFRKKLEQSTLQWATNFDWDISGRLFEKEICNILNN